MGASMKQEKMRWPSRTAEVGTSSRHRVPAGAHCACETYARHSAEL